MSIAQANGVCPAILVGLDSLLGQDPNRFATAVGGVQSTLDPENTRGVTMEQVGDGQNGHRKSVRIMHKQRAVVSDVGDSKTCTEGDERAIFEENFDVNLHSELSIKMTEAHVRALCDAYSQFQVLSKTKGDASGQIAVMRDFAENIMMDLNAIRTDINQKFLTTYAISTGTYQGGNTSNTYPVIKSADNALVLTGFNVFKQDLRKINSGLVPIVFGGGNMDLAISAAEYGCCNNAGQDFGVMRNQGAGFKFYQDYEDMATYLGNANAIGAFMPKSVQFVPYNKYVGNFQTQIGIMSRGLMPDPVLPGIKYDIRLKPNECGEYYNLWVNLDYDFWFAPTNIFKSGDRLEGVNGVLKAIASAI